MKDTKIKLRVPDKNGTERTVNFELRNDTYNRIKLVAVDQNNRKIVNGTLLFINPEGYCICSNLNSDIGLPLNGKGCLKQRKALNKEK